MKIRKNHKAVEAHNERLRIRLQQTAGQPSKVTVFHLKENGYCRQKATFEVADAVTIQQLVKVYGAIKSVVEK
ncbi:MAG: hypothetical protein R2795_09905 [Saprospiraceae bacterium]